ncbi:type IV secretion protein Rhs, partial [Ralstonia solanacearum]
GPAATKNSYDTAGNLTSDGTTTYSYSDRGRLASVTKSGTTTSYLYNGLGQRVVKSGSNVPTGATRYVYDEADHLIGEYDQSGNALQETVYLGDTPIATVKNGTPYYIYADQIDTPRVITDTNNLMVWRWDQADPFGATLPDENPTSLGTFTYNLRFPGQVYDQETGKHYNANRDYDPAGGRYIQSDPIGLNGGQWSTYSYVGGNPLSATDPMGLQTAVANDVVRISLPGIGAACAATGGSACAAAAIGAVGVGGYLLTDRYVNPWAQPLIAGAIDRCTAAASNQNSAMHDPANRRQRQYEAAKARCTPPNPPPEANCSELSKMIDSLQNSIDRYTYFDAMYSPGRHAQKIEEIKNRINGLKDRYNTSCTGCK